ncbi:MAG: GMC family oxidoreductase [Thermoflexus hugenholtzii]|jgi:choline dehydrogenase-like flavoprotein|uniref:FAD-dependent oxidoreductase n=1 Tax=Thermoflexus TaxID=1495649 RepID=UPI001C75480F|nr:MULTISPECIES: GMC family oxidoreductase [Thermoflexus]QWK11359.1 MAG: GMC family oxidoreductase [Thermoflexus hugenholtzii]
MGMLRWEAEVVVVGTGPGGATVARELARAGRRVLLLERGGPERGRPLYGTHLGALRYTERGGLFFTPEGIQVVAPRMVGGATGMFAGCAAPPPDWLRTKYGIDLRQEVAETIEELGIAPLPPEHRGAASTRLAEAARALGYAVYPQPKFIRPERAPRFRCGAHCLLGCRCGAKWSAAEFVEEAVRAGALLLPYAFVERVLLEGGRAVGVAGRIRGQPFIAQADQVVLAAGGLGTPRILQASGFRGIGEGLAMDLTVIVYGRSRTDGNASDPPMTWSWEDPGLEVMFSTLMDPWLLYPLVAGMSGLRHVATWPRWRQMLGVMIKLRDALSGRLHPDGSLSKPLTPTDRDRLQEAVGIARRILAEAGADPASIFVSPMRGTHPSATVRIGEWVDADLRTEVRGLYVCDASVFPEALGRPTVLTLIALGKRLARSLVEA